MEKKKIKARTMKSMLELTITHCERLIKDEYYNTLDMDDYDKIKEAYMLILQVNNLAIKAVRNKRDAEKHGVECNI